MGELLIDITDVYPCILSALESIVLKNHFLHKESEEDCASILEKEKLPEDITNIFLAYADNFRKYLQEKKEKRSSEESSENKEPTNQEPLLGGYRGKIFLCTLAAVTIAAGTAGYFESAHLKEMGDPMHEYKWLVGAYGVAGLVTGMVLGKIASILPYEEINRATKGVIPSVLQVERIKDATEFIKELSGGIKEALYDHIVQPLSKDMRETRKYISKLRKETLAELISK